MDPVTVFDARSHGSRLFLVVAVLSLLVAACSPGGDDVPFLSLGQRVVLPEPDPGEVAPLRMAVGAILSPEGNIESYGDFADYLADRLGRPVEIVQRRTYREINDLLRSGDVDIGFVCTSAYVAGHDEFGLRLLAAPQIGGVTVYYSVLIVPADSDAQSIGDLRGATFAFTDPMSTTGRVYPTSLVQGLGETPEGFFGRTMFTYSHERAIEAVAARVADGAGVDSLVLDHLLAREPNLPVRVIDRSPAFMIPPVVASPSLSPRQAAAVQEILLGIDQDPAAVPILEVLGIERFVVVADTAYDSVRDLLARVDLAS